MTLRFYDSAAGSIRDFVPITPGAVGIYVCGATVQGPPHIGHLRSALVFDQFRTWLAVRGFDVTFVRNVTDIDDKILLNADEAGIPWWAVAYIYEREFTAAYDALAILPPDYEPRAGGHIPEMVHLIQRLLENGHAYPATDGSGDVYFDARSWPEYGSLTRQKLEDMAPAADAEPRGKKDPRDFALWKGHKKHEPDTAAWQTPWGAGRPGWHVECSAMSTKYLGGNFDIHGGGLDLRFPHHENERAQSQAAGDSYANYWIHNGLVAINGEKMSKSLGNSVFAGDLLSRAKPLVVRYYLGGAHYRSVLDFRETSLREAGAAVERIESFIRRATEHTGYESHLSFPWVEADDPHRSESLNQKHRVQWKALFQYLPEAFVKALDDDMGIPAALAVLHDQVRSGNAAIDQGDSDTVESALLTVVAITDVLGINPISAPWHHDAAGGADSRSSDALKVLVDAQLAARDTARSEKDYRKAEEIRDTLLKAGIKIEDSAQGVHWSLEESATD